MLTPQFNGIGASKEDREVFSRNLQILLHERHMLQSELAERTGLAESTISSYIVCKRYPKLEISKEISNVLGCRLSELLGHDPAYYGDTNDIRYMPPDEYQTLSTEDRQLVNMMIRELSRIHTN